MELAMEIPEGHPLQGVVLIHAKHMVSCRLIGVQAWFSYLKCQCKSLLVAEVG
jgi:hypothetical protein